MDSTGSSERNSTDADTAVHLNGTGYASGTSVSGINTDSGSNKRKDKNNRMGRSIGMLAVALGTGLLVTAIAATLISSVASNASSGARLGTESANLAEEAIRQTDTIENKDFSFPSVFGNNFYTANPTSGSSPGQTSGITTNNTSARNKSNTAGNSWTGRTNTAGTNSYTARYINSNTLNFDSPERNAYLDSLDNLYVLCADVAAANTECSKKALAVRAAASELRQLSSELRATNITRTAQNASAFDHLNSKSRELKNAVRTLNRDRGSLKKLAKTFAKNTDGLNAERSTANYTAMMNKVETRIKMLDDIVKAMDGMCDATATLIGKTRTANHQNTAAAQAPNVNFTPSSQENTAEKSQGSTAVKPSAQQFEERSLRPLPLSEQTEQQQPTVNQEQTAPDNSLTYLNKTRRRNFKRLTPSQRRAISARRQRQQQGTESTDNTSTNNNIAAYNNNLNNGTAAYKNALTQNSNVSSEKMQQFSETTAQRLQRIRERRQQRAQRNLQNQTRTAPQSVAPGAVELRQNNAQTNQSQTNEIQNQDVTPETAAPNYSRFQPVINPETQAAEKVHTHQETQETDNLQIRRMPFKTQNSTHNTQQSETVRRSTSETSGEPHANSKLTRRKVWRAPEISKGSSSQTPQLVWQHTA